MKEKCLEFVKEAIKEDPTLKPVRGFYHCPIEGKQEHWWCKKPDGTIYDPTASQFASPNGIYEEFDGYCECANCGAKTLEEDTYFHGKTTYCSEKCGLQHTGGNYPYRCSALNWKKEFDIEVEQEKTK